jgi:ketosteroid isomerase-like protein
MDGIALAHKLFDGIERGDMETFHELCHPDSTMWQAQRPDTERSFGDFFRGIPNMHAAMPNMRYAERDYALFEGGDIFCLHALAGTTFLGVDVRAHQMMRLRMRDGKMARLEMCVDTVRLQPLYEAMQALAKAKSQAS